MRQFDFCYGISGSRVVIYPAGTLARREQGHYVDAPYLDIQTRTHFSDYFELVRRGRVVKRGVLPFRHPHDLDDSIKQLLALMQEL